MSVGKRILSLRKRDGISQEQLASAIGTTRQAVSKWESGKSQPDIDYVIKTGAYFHVTMDYLLLGTENAGNQTDCIPPSSQPPSTAKYKFCYLCFSTVSVLSILSLILLPVFSSMYCDLMRNLGPVYTDPTQYLHEWPLIGVKWLGVIGLLFGAGGIIVTYMQTQSSKP